MSLERIRGVAGTAPTLARVCLLAALDRARPLDTTDPAQVPYDPAAISTAWLTAALCAGVPGARVTAAAPTGGSSGTTRRLGLGLSYNGTGRAAGLPARVFTKSTPALRQRITQAITGPVEARFYTRLRPLLSIEAPVCFHGAVDARRMTAITVLEDLVETKQAV
ncbi:MAG: aminoglycoside phosphotransferase family protein, partial [Solirubrobacterales bacterium]|nr:aminoglycoside phosphotransferase family protein [Solirubrobacterales bacterium]